MILNPDPQLTEQSISWLRITSASLVVLGLMGGLAFLLKLAQTKGWLGHASAFFDVKNKSGKKRLRIVESLPLDIRRRLVIVACDEKEHLILLGAQQDIVIAPTIGSLSQHPPQKKA